MHPELFKIPFTELTVKSYGVMVVIGFFLSVVLIKKMCKRVNADSEKIINSAFYSFIVGIIGARIFHVVHYRDQFDSFLSMLEIWKGGLELLGGVIPAILFLLLYLKLKNMKVLLSLDILAAALMIGIGLGRIGCFLNGCCFGQPTSLPIGVVFPYNSIPYQSQAYPDSSRDRAEPIIKLPADFYGYEIDGTWHIATESTKYNYALKPKELLTEQQKAQVVKKGKYACAAVHPTQLYSTVAAFINCILLSLFWWNFGSGQINDAKRKFAAGSTGALMLVLYSVCRYSIELLRGDNPYETATFTVSQLISIAMLATGVIMFIVCNWRFKASKNT